MVIGQEDARTPTGRGNGHLQDGDSEAVQDELLGQERRRTRQRIGKGIFQRIRITSGIAGSIAVLRTGRHDSRGRLPPSPFLLWFAGEIAALGGVDDLLQALTNVDHAKHAKYQYSDKLGLGDREVAFASCLDHAGLQPVQQRDNYAADRQKTVEFAGQRGNQAHQHAKPEEQYQPHR